MLPFGRHKMTSFLVQLYLCTFYINCTLLKDVSAQGLITNALFLGEPENFNSSLADCVWKRTNERASCPDPAVEIILYTNRSSTAPQKLNIKEGDWLRNSAHNPEHDNILLIHGYAGGDNQLPTVVLRDAYLANGAYNVFVVDWGALAKPPCYVAAVHNLRPVANCLAQSLIFLRNSGLRIERTTCVGHSLGAHMCGNMANYLNFRMEKIIGLDPARPLIKNGNRLDRGHAKAVQVVHTNAGRYGEGGRIGHVDFCINGGRRQPFCSGTTNENLCSHVWAVCYLAETLFNESSQFEAEPCTRKCPAGPVIGQRRGPRDFNRYAVGNLIPMGHRTPNYAFGSFCLKDDSVPFCLSAKKTYGDQRCCLQPAGFSKQQQQQQQQQQPQSPNDNIVD